MAVHTFKTVDKTNLTAAKAGNEGAAGAAAPGQEGLPGEGDGTPPPEAKTPSERPTARNTSNSGDGGERPADSEPSSAEATEGEPAEDETPAKTPAKRDWVKEAYECFVKDAKDIDPTDPVKAIEVYFEKNANDGLKARCKAEGKDAKGCWKFIETVARKALHGSSGHIDPAVVYAIAMHWFEDVPKDWDAGGRRDGEMSESETLADIVAEMRKDIPRVVDARIILRNYADRIEAAAKREAATTEKSSVVGNAAKMREALLKIVRELNSLDESCAVDPVDIRVIAMEALAESQRNCDNAATWLDMYKNFHAPKGMREMPPEWVDAIAAFCKWILATAERGRGDESPRTEPESEVQ